jgi:predicted transcriptional regulator
MSLGDMVLFFADRGPFFAHDFVKENRWANREHVYDQLRKLCDKGTLKRTRAIGPSGSPAWQYRRAE